MGNDGENPPEHPRGLDVHGAEPVTHRFTITDASDQLSAVKSVMRELRVHETAMHPSAVLAQRKTSAT